MSARGMWLFHLLRNSCCGLAFAALAVPAVALAAVPDGVWLRTVGGRLASAIAPDCPASEAQTGLVLHDIAGFRPDERELAMREYRLGGGFGIVAVVPGSPAERAGLSIGDEIVAVEARPMAGFRADLIGRKATYDRVEAFEDLLASALRSGLARLQVRRRGGAPVPVVLEAEPSCAAGRFVVMPDREVNAWSNGKYVAVSSAMMALIADDDELAFVVAHEMAHNLLGHNGGGAVAARLLGGEGRASSRNRELAADALALRFVIAAGYDPDAAQELLDRMQAGGHGGGALSHPAISRRIANVHALIARYR